MPSGDSQQPRVRVAPDARQTDGDLAAAFASAYDLTPDEWQHNVLNDWLSLRAGKWASLTCGLSVPRQNGKNALLEMRELYGMVGLGEKILHTAQEVKTAQKHFRRLQYFFGKKDNDPAARFPELNALVERVRLINGQEAVVLKNGGSIEIIARSRSSGRGFTVDLLVMDEAQDLSEDELEALMPTTSASPTSNPQWIFTGTPPTSSRGEVFRRVRADALSGHPKRLSWHEWSPPEEYDLDDRALWRMTNPGLDSDRLQLEVIEGERARFSDEGFARERLGLWDAASSPRVIDEESWEAARDAASMATDRLTLAVDVAPDRSVATVAFAGLRPDGLWHVEVDDTKKGTDWIGPWVAARAQRNRLHAVVVDEMSGLVENRKGRNYLVGTDVVVTLAASEGRDMAIACAKLYDSVVAPEPTVRHTDQPQLNVAVSVARKRPLGAGWAWNRKDGTSDITPVVAVTLALWGAQKENVERPTRRNSERTAVIFG